MPDFSNTNITGVLVALFGIAVLFLAIVSLTTFAVLYKNAEKRSVATGITVVYVTLFILIIVLAFTSFATL